MPAGHLHWGLTGFSGRRSPELKPCARPQTCSSWWGARTLTPAGQDLLMPPLQNLLVFPLPLDCRCLSPGPPYCLGQCYCLPSGFLPLPTHCSHFPPGSSQGPGQRRHLIGCSSVVASISLRLNSSSRLALGGILVIAPRGLSPEADRPLARLLSLSFLICKMARTVLRLRVAVRIT